MSTEAMRVQRWTGQVTASDAGGFVSYGDYLELKRNQEALIKAALDAAAILCDGYEGGDWFADAIRQITPQQVMERLNDGKKI